jgi:glycosyltransferase XagB
VDSPLNIVKGNDVRELSSGASSTSRGLLRALAGEGRRRAVRYTLVSVVSVAVSQSVLGVAFGMLHWTARLSNVVACSVATLPSYQLNRSWVWGRRGRSRLWREVVPFWALAFLGLAFSTWAADLGSTLARRAGTSRELATLIVMTSALAAFGILWVGKFAVFNGLLFVERPSRGPHGPAREPEDGVTSGAGGAVRVLAVAAAAGVLLLGPTGAHAAGADPHKTASVVAPTTDPPTTVPPTTDPATTQPPTTAPPTTAPPTTAPAATAPPTTAPATTLPPSTDPPTTSAAGGAGVAPTAAGGGLPSTTTPVVGGAAGRGSTGTRGSGPPANAGGTQGASPEDAAGLGSQRPPSGPAIAPQKVLRGLLRDGPARLTRQVAAATDALRRLSPVGFALFVLLSLVSFALTAIAGTTLWWMLHAWRTAHSLAETGFSGSAADPRLSFSLIVPARHEEAVLGATLSRLAALDHPAFEIVCVVGDDDPGTAAVAQRAARRHPNRIRVLVDASQPKNKPKALNTALPACRGDVVGVFDAEDEVHPQLLRHVDARFVETGADVVQGGVQLMDYHSSWYAVRNVLEYYFWFRSRLHFHAAQRFIPLGGNTVFVRAELLRWAGGWDPACLAEDCELGVRLSSIGARVAVAYDPALVTREETPSSLKAFLKQRTRWNQGFLQVLRKGQWRRLPTARQRLLARYTLAMPFLQAFTAPLIPLSFLAMLLLKVPVLAALLTFLPLTPTLVVLIVEVVGFGEFCRDYGCRARPLDYLRLVLGTFLYHVLLAAAAVRAVVREVRGHRGWEKTAHVGAHRSLGPDAPAPLRLGQAGDRPA